MTKQVRLVRWCVVVTLLGVAFAQAQGEEPVKYWAVICGVADYESIGGLNYTDDDAYDLLAALEQYPEWQGPDQIEILIDSAASKEGILDAIGRMGEKAKDGDLCLFFFSGHGTQVVDTSGDEADRKDEAICPWDTDTTRFLETVITDDDLASWLVDCLPENADIVAIFDTCFAGGMAEGAKGLSVKSVRNRNLPPQAKVRRRFGRGLAQRLAARGAKGRVTGSEDIGGANAVVLMACKEGGLSYETSSLENGVFSYYVVEGLCDLSIEAPQAEDDNGDGFISAEEDFAYAAPKTTKLVRRQKPRLYGGNPDLDVEALLVQVGEPAPPPEEEDVVTITKAEYNSRKQELKVEATSTAGGTAVLTVYRSADGEAYGEAYGDMTYDSRKNIYKFRAKGVADPGDTVTVTSSLGGSATAPVKRR